MIFWCLVTWRRHPCNFSSSSGEGCPGLPPGHMQTWEEHLVYLKCKKILVLHLYAIACWELWFSFIFNSRNLKLTQTLSVVLRETPDWDTCPRTHQESGKLFNSELRQKFHHALQILLNIGDTQLNGNIHRIAVSYYLSVPLSGWEWWQLKFNTA